MKIAIYAGSFNPVHNGHLAVAEAALAEGFDEVWLVVSPQNPHKSEAELWPFDERYEMVVLATSGYRCIKPNDCEKNLPMPSYTIHTLEFLQKSYPQHHFSLLIGEDNLINFHLWKEHGRIIELFGLVVYPRSPSTLSTDENLSNLTRMKAPLINVSSSEIRNKLLKHESIKGMVPEAVESFIFLKLTNDPSKSHA